MDRMKKLLAIALVICMILSMGEAFALADAEPEETPAAEETTVLDPEADAPPSPEPESTPAPGPMEEETTDVTAPDEAEPTPAPAGGTEPEAVDGPEEPEPAEESGDAASEEPDEEEVTEEPSERAWREPGNTSSEILGGGVYLRAGSSFYYSEMGVWVDRGGETQFLSADDAGGLNLMDGWLYYTVGSDVRRVPAEGGAVETVYSHDSAIRQMYVMGPELRFLADGSVWSYFMDTEELERFAAPANILGFMPTPFGNLYLTGAVLEYTLWAERTKLYTGIERCYTDGDHLVAFIDGALRQAVLEDLFDGVCSFTAYSLHQEYAGNGLSDDEQLANEAAYLQSAEYESMMDALAVESDGYYTASNSKIARLASSSLDANQTNIVKRARQMAEVKWTPIYDLYSWGGNDSSYVQAKYNGNALVVATDGTETHGWFKSGKTYQGVPYAQAVYTGYVGWDVSLDSFVSAVNNSSSKFYKGYSTYSRTAPYYGSDCSGFVSWAWDLDYRRTCTSLLSASSRKSGSIQNFQVGDCLNNPSSHVVLITDLGYDSSGKIVSVEITEQTPCKMRVTCYGELIPNKTYQYYNSSLNYINTYYLNGGYALYSRNYSRSVRFTASSAVDLDANSNAPAPKVSVAVNSDGTAKIVTLTHSVSTADIYYTTDGSAATKNSTLYTGPFEVTTATTVKAIADCGSRYKGSDMVTYEISVSKADKPFVILIEGYMDDEFVSKGSKISIMNNSGDTIYYTTDGSLPTRSSAQATSAGITVDGDMTLKAVAVSTADLNSESVDLEVKVGSFYEIQAISAGAGGYIAPGGSIGVLPGTEQSFKIVPLTHYVIDDVKVDGASVGAVTEYTFPNITADHTIEVTFRVEEPFADVKQNAWYQDSVSFVYAQGLFAGMSQTEFAPNAYMDRGMFITVLGRFAGEGQWTDLASWSGRLGITQGSAIAIRKYTNTSDVSTIFGRTGAPESHLQILSTVAKGEDGGTWYEVPNPSTDSNDKKDKAYIREEMPDATAKTLVKAYTGSFTDLPNGVYYTGYAQWANIEGIMSGTSATTFDPKTSIRRCDICLLLYRYLTNYCGRTLPASSEAFTDDAAIPGYARTAVYAMRQAGIVNGIYDKTTGTYSFDPMGYATRAQVAQMFANLYRYTHG